MLPFIIVSPPLGGASKEVIISNGMPPALLLVSMLTVLSIENAALAVPPSVTLIVKGTAVPPVAATGRYAFSLTVTLFKY